MGKEGRQGKIWNSRIACLAVASHPLHQEKKRREVGFVPPKTAEWWEARVSLRGSPARQGELSESERGNQPRPIQGSEKEVPNRDQGMALQIRPDRVDDSYASIASAFREFTIYSLPDFLSSRLFTSPLGSL